VKQFWIANLDNSCGTHLPFFCNLSRVNDQNWLIYQHLMLQLIFQTFELSFHPTMLAIRHLRTFLVDLNVLCLLNQNRHFWIIETKIYIIEFQLEQIRNKFLRIDELRQSFFSNQSSKVINEKIHVPSSIIKKLLSCFIYWIYQIILFYLRISNYL